MPFQRARGVAVAIGPGEHDHGGFHGPVDKAPGDSVQVALALAGAALRRYGAMMPIWAVLLVAIASIVATAALTWVFWRADGRDEP